MPKRESYTRIRLYDKEKEQWEEYANNNKFASLSQFIRYVVSEYIEHGFSRLPKINEKNNMVSKRERLDLYEEQLKIQKKELNETRKKLDELIEERRKEQKIKITHNIKGKILKWVEEFNGELGSEHIADIIALNEPDTVDILNKMEEQEFLRLNKKMKYEMVSNENN